VLDDACVPYVCDTQVADGFESLGGNLIELTAAVGGNVSAGNAIFGAVAEETCEHLIYYCL
jgi:hypothetical protein